VPIDPTTREDHRPKCTAEQGRVPDRLKRPVRHVLSPSAIERHDECQRRFYYERVVKVKLDAPDESSAPMDAGKLTHATIEAVAVERARTGDLARPVTADELLAALESPVAPRERWTSGALAIARDVLARSAPRIDLSFVAVDEHGPFVERGFEMPVGEGALVGGIMDVVELVGDAVLVRDWKTGQMREPDPVHAPAVGIYGAWARLLWPDREVHVILDYLALEDESEVTGSDLDRAVGHATSVARALVAKVRAKAQDESAWPATFGGACATCPFSRRCETYQERMKAPAADLEPETLGELVEAIYHLAPVATVAEKVVKRLRKKAIGPAVSARLDGDGRALVGRHPIRLRTVTRKGYTADATTYQVLDVDPPIEEPAPADTVEVAPETPALPAPPSPPPPAPVAPADPVQAAFASLGEARSDW